MITAMVIPKMRKRPPTAVGMVTRRVRCVPVPLTAVVASVPLVMKTLGISEMLTVVLLVSGRVTAASAE